MAYDDKPGCQCKPFGPKMYGESVASSIGRW